MTRNQLSPNVVKKFSGGVVFTVEGNGDVTPTAEQFVSGGDAIVTQQDTASVTPFSGQICARQNNVCQCTALVGVPSGSHMAIGTGYTISSSLQSGSEFEIYAITSSGPVANASVGDIHVGS